MDEADRVPPPDLVIAVAPRLLGDVLAHALRTPDLSVGVWDERGEVVAAVVLVNDDVPEGVRGELVVHLPPVPGEPALVEGPRGPRHVHLSSLEELRALLGSRFPAAVAVE